jgi:chemotaxis protein MotB
MSEDGGGKKRPIIIKRKKGGGGDGHHGGAWKVAYADFVTAMMAFFLLMWLLNATSEEQKKGLADYFDDRIPLVRQSGGGDGAFKGDSMVSNQDLARAGGGVATEEAGRASGKGTKDSDRSGPSDEPPPEKVAEAKAFAALEQAFDSLSGESDVTDRMLSHVRTRTTEDGLVIDVFDTEDAPLFDPGTDRPTPTLEALASVVASVAALVKNPVAITGHTDAAIVGGTGDAGDWRLSSDRALATRGLLVGAGLDGGRIAEVTGRAATRPLSDDPLDPRNRRIEITLLRIHGNR